MNKCQICSELTTMPICLDCITECAECGCPESCHEGELIHCISCFDCWGYIARDTERFK